MELLANWLARHGLEAHRDTLVEAGVDLDIIDEITEADLAQFGFSYGDRKRFARAVRERALREDASPIDATSTPEAAEFRQLTVMFADMVGSVALGQQMNVEDYRDLLAGFRNLVVTVVEAHQGFIARHHGDGVLVYFGYPSASESDAERAVDAALQIVAAVRAFEHPYRHTVEVRIGVATGTAIVGDVLTTSHSAQAELAALGPTPNLAARLQGLAHPGTAVISATTERLVSGFFETTPLAALSLKGIDGELVAYRVDGRGSTETRFGARALAAQSTLVGRDEELSALHHRWAAVTRGEGQAVVISGEAGIGKSRLTSILIAHVHALEAETLLLQCTPDRKSIALHPVVSALRLVLARYGEDSPARDRLRHWMIDRGFHDEETEQTLAQFLALGSPQATSSQASSPDIGVCARTLAAVIRYVTTLSARGPSLVVVEDMHWADPSTDELLGEMVEAIEQLPVMVVATGRTGYDPPWSDAPHVRALRLSRLGKGEGAAIAKGVADLSQEILADVIARGGGIPLYIEELARAAATGARSGLHEAIPSTLQDSLRARLDALTRGKRVAQCASVIGREFTLETLAFVWDGPASELRAGTAELVSSGLIAERLRGGETQFSFHHALFRDAVYQSLLREPRRALHARLAEALQTLDNTTDAAIAAHHFTEAGDLLNAARLWEAAGDSAAARSATSEALGDYAAALDAVLQGADYSPAAELRIQTKRGPLLMTKQGIGSAEVETTFDRAAALADKVNASAEQQFPIHWGLWYLHAQRTEHTAARSAAARMQELGRQSGNAAFTIEANHAVWTDAFHYGRFADAAAAIETALAHYDRQEHAGLRHQFGNHDPCVCGYSHQAMFDAVMAKPDKARQYKGHAQALADAIEHPPSSVIASVVGLLVEFLAESPEGALLALPRAREATIRVGSAYGLWVDMFEHWARSRLGESGHASGQRQVLDKLSGLGTVVRLPLFYAMLADSMVHEGNARGAQEAAEEGLSIARDTGQTGYEAYCHRMVGISRLHVDANGRNAAVHHLETACRLAQRIDDRMNLVLAATALSGLYLEDNRRDSARALLQEISPELAEGGDAAWAVAARELLSYC